MNALAIFDNFYYYFFSSIGLPCAALYNEKALQYCVTHLTNSYQVNNNYNNKTSLLATLLSCIYLQWIQYKHFQFQNQPTYHTLDGVYIQHLNIQQG